MTLTRTGRNTVRMLVLAGIMFGPLQVFGQTDLAGIEPSIAKLASYEYGQDFAPLAAVSRFIREAKGDRDVLAQLEQRLLAVLRSDATQDGKKFVCEQLSVIGTASSVPLLAQMVTVPATSDIARYALARIQGPEAAAALRAGLEKAGTRESIGIINSLGWRRDPGAASVLTPLIYAADSGIAAAAVNSLGQIGDSAALKSLNEARRAVTGLLLEQVTDAYIRCLENVAGKGRELALAGYRQLNDVSEPAMIRVAALRGLVQLDPHKAAETIAGALQTGTPTLQAAAIQLTAAIPGPEVTDLMIRNYPKLGARGRVQMLAALALRGDPSARTLLEQALKDEALEVRIGALEGIGKLGDAAQVGRLAEMASSGSDAERAAARLSLYGLNAAGVDEAILKALGSAAPKVKVELIRAAGERRIEAAAGTLLGTAGEADSEVRRESRRALRETAETRHLPGLLRLLAESKTSSERTDLENALTSTVKRYEMSGADQLTSAIGSADLETRASLLQVLGRLGYEPALPLLRTALKDDAPELQRAAVLGLTEWPTPAPIPDLMQAAGGAAAKNVQVLALRGVIRLAGLGSQRTRAESVKLLADALHLGPADEEKKAILSLLPRFTSTEALQLAETLQGGSVAEEAKLAVQRIKHALEQK